MKNQTRLYEIIYKTFAAWLILSIFYTVATPQIARAATVEAPFSLSETNAQDEFDKKFREGRNLIDAEEWARAAEKFGEAIEKDAGNKSADAALYWLAFCHKKQKKFKESGAALARLLEKFPASSWASDARVMQLEIGAPTGGIIAAQNAIAARNAQTLAMINETYGVTATSATTAKGADAAQALQYFENSLTGELYKSTAPLEREDEIKIAAFQSLFAADPKRAIGTMGEILKPDSKASETLKQEILRVLRTPRLSRSENFSFAVSGGTAAVGKEFAPLLRETLVKGFQTETNIKIRKEIINALANLGEQSTDYLKNLYAAESDREIKRTIINSFSGSANRFYDYGFAANVAQSRKIDSGVLLEIVRTERDAELRRLAFANLQRFQNWSQDAGTIDALTRIYDADADEAFKIAVIRAFAVAKQNQATEKLVSIAKNDKSDKLRLAAIYSLRTSKNPEVLKFLEDLIK